MSRSIVRITAAFALVAIITVGFLVVKQRREAEGRRQQAVQMGAALSAMRDAIGSFRATNERYPASLDELVKYGQLTVIPTDPVTSATTTWVLVTEERVPVSDDFTGTSADATTSLIDVRSGAPGNDPAGRPWSSY